MKEQIFIIILIATICLAHPDQLKQQRYEFQEFHTSSSHDKIASFPENGRLQVAPVPVQHKPILWSQQHQNEVNAFAEMFRQKYNQMINQYNRMMQMHHHSLINPFMPVAYELYHVPDEVMWKNYFGKQQQYVHDQTEQMSRQLIQDLEKGRVSPQDLMNPNFFVAQAASELNRVHQVQNEFETNDEQVANSFGDTYQQHQFDTINAQQQQQHQIFAESTHHQETEGKDQVLVYNQKTGEYQYVTTVAAPEVPPHEELAGAMISNANMQRLSSVRFNNEMLNKFSQEVTNIEINTPVSVETPRLSEQHFNKGVDISTYKPLETTEDEFYRSTYDQQPIYDLRFVESVSSTARPSKVNVMSLVRNKAKVKISSTTSEPFQTNIITTDLPTTESSIMSMLPNKKTSYNYTDIYHKVRAELNRQMKQIPDNKSEETHFMGMTSNIDHVKLSYETIQDGKDHKESRGDQPSKTDDYISEEYVESELVVPTTSIEPSSTPSPISSTVKPIRGYQNPFGTASLALFTTTTIKSPNPYYTAPLAPFPDDIFKEPQVTAQSQVEHSELSDINQELQVIDHPNGSHFVVEDTSQGEGNHRSSCSN
ncbi:uncharacterized protein LOC135714715 isoform X2 [Ochlerotatus camptorhynchus]|uniref:uncharacterized protein LOC135714715 isoform X2 n=1 Tax=Ochlerotatus camptorhynchus TaxID=644619 RepID=UPI0031CEDC2B